MEIEDLENLLDEFLDRWNIEEVRKMTLSEYVGLGNKDTFCQWIETKTRMLGSMKGLPGSIKFGIYERHDKNKKPKKYDNDERFSWLKAYNCVNSNDAFNKVKDDIMKTIEFSEKGDFKSIDYLLLPAIFKWKIAFLYSNERLIPIYKSEVLVKIANSYGLTANKDTPISNIQSIMIENKPPNLNIYEYMEQLYVKFGKSNQETEEESREKRLRKRKAAKSRDIISQLRRGTRSYIVEQKHNKLQEILKKKLVEKYGEENVKLEEDYVDIKLLQPNCITFYEVKSHSFASGCMKEALGQILFYSFYDTDLRYKKLIVVGQYPPNDFEKRFIDFLKAKLNVDYEYMELET